MKINKNTANDYTYYEKYKKQYYVYCAITTYFFQNHLELSYKLFYLDVIPSPQNLHYTLQLFYQLTFFYSYTIFIV